jgi:hypothetical protein
MPLVSENLVTLQVVELVEVRYLLAVQETVDSAVVVILDTMTTMVNLDLQIQVVVVEPPQIASHLPQVEMVALA